MPFALSERVMNALKADPRTIDLRALAPHFYNLSQRILELFEEEEMVDVLSTVYPPPWTLEMKRKEKERIVTDHEVDISKAHCRDCGPGA